jgi:medium-chain acyl-[acyl-carrier-protein] hydrolase
LYSTDGRIRYSEVGTDRKLTMESLLDYYQDVATFQTEDLGIGIEYMMERRLAWILSSWQVVIKRYPSVGERIRTSTIPYEWKSFLGYRNFLMETSDGEPLSYANSIWVLMDMGKGMPCKIPQELLDRFELNGKYPMEYEPRKIKMPDGGERMEPIIVKQHHLDTNEHVNNGQYVKMALDFVPEDMTVWQMRADYRRSAKLEDRMTPVVSKEGDRYSVNLEGDDGNPYCYVEFRTK